MKNPYNKTYIYKILFSFPIIKLEKQNRGWEMSGYWFTEGS